MHTLKICRAIEDSDSEAEEAVLQPVVVKSTCIRKGDVIKRLKKDNHSFSENSQNILNNQLHEKEHLEETQEPLLFPLNSTPTNKKVIPLSTHPKTKNATETAGCSSSMESFTEEHFNITTSSQSSELAEESVKNVSSSSSTDGEDFKELKSMVKILVNQNKSILERLDVLEKTPGKKKKEDVVVPNHMRYQIKLAYKEREKQDEALWKVNEGLSAFEGENLVVSNHLREFLKGLNPSLENRDIIINRCIKTYFTSKETQGRRKSKSPNAMKDLARKQRRIHLAQRRKRALCKYVLEEKIDKDSKDKFAGALIPEMMSSEDEKEDENGSRYFIVRKPVFRAKRFSKLLKIIDCAYEKNCSKRSREQMVRREVGEPSHRSPPTTLSSDLVDLFITK